MRSVKLTEAATEPLSDAQHYDALHALSQLVEAAHPGAATAPAGTSSRSSRLLASADGTTAVLDIIDTAPRSTRPAAAGQGSADAA